MRGSLACVVLVLAACRTAAVPEPPTNLTYSTNPAVYVAGLAIVPNVPSSTGGAVDVYSVAPALPDGLVLDPATGVISGTPGTSAPQASHAVTASNVAGGTTTSLAITVIEPVAPMAPVVSVAGYVTAGKPGLVASTQDQGPGMTYTWTLSRGAVSSGQGTPSITFTVGIVGELTVSVRVTSPRGAASGAAGAIVVPAPDAELALPTEVHPGDDWMRASVPVQDGMAYQWIATPGPSTGGITSGQGTGVISFSAGGSPGTFQIQSIVQNKAGDRATATRSIAVQTGTWVVKDGGPPSILDGSTAVLLPSGRVLVAGGCWYGSEDGSSSAKLYDPATGRWMDTGSLATPRCHHAATLLANGRVLVVGGAESMSGILASAEVFDPATGTWTPAGALWTARARPTATLLPDGRVLVAGGYTASNYLASAELYDPTTGAWTPTGDMANPRCRHSATLLGDGRVLVAGGLDGSPVSVAEVYDPATGTWISTGRLGIARQEHTATRLANGTVLVAGGDGASYGVLASAELYDPPTGTWTTTGSLGSARDEHTATLLPDGTVLVAGGFASSGYVASAETYDPAAGTWAAADSMTSARCRHTATRLLDGRVLVEGGEGLVHGSPEIYDPATRGWLPAGWPGPKRTGHTATLLLDGDVLVAGGDEVAAAIYDPPTRIWTGTGSLSTTRAFHTATLLGNGMVLVAGGFSTSTHLASAELYDPTAGTWAGTGSLHSPRSSHGATRLDDGTVLVTGGFTGHGMSATAEVYDPSSGTWASTGSMAVARVDHTATLLPDGRVLVAGGSESDPPAASLASAEIYDPATGVWTATGSLGTLRQAHTATLLHDGTVLVAGGHTGSQHPVTLSTAEIYDPATGRWTATANLGVARAYHSATRLSGGNVLVASGFPARESAEVYDVTTGAWTPTGRMTNDCHSPAILLGDGTVIVCLGGEFPAQTYRP